MPSVLADNAFNFASSDEDVSISWRKKPSPEGVELCSVSNLRSREDVRRVMLKEARRPATRWLAVHVEQTSSTLLFLPRKASPGNLAQSGLVACMEWLEDIGMSQLFVAVNVQDPAATSIVKSLMFLGFGKLLPELGAASLPYLSEAYAILVTDLSDI